MICVCLNCFRFLFYLHLYQCSCSFFRPHTDVRALKDTYRRVFLHIQAGRNIHTDDQKHQHMNQTEHTRPKHRNMNHNSHEDNTHSMKVNTHTDTKKKNTVKQSVVFLSRTWSN